MSREHGTLIATAYEGEERAATVMAQFTTLQGEIVLDRLNCRP